MPKPAIIVVDEQYDFMPGGSLAVTDGDQVVPVTNILIGEVMRSNGIVVASRDWHPAETSHFAEWGGTWPPHCVAGTRGADFHDNLQLPDGACIVSKGTKKDQDAYSAFDGHSGGRYLNEILVNNEVNKVIVCGLATDYCVKATVIDACRLGFDVRVAVNACRAVNINPGDENEALNEMRLAGAKLRGSSYVWLD